MLKKLFTSKNEMISHFFINDKPNPKHFSLWQVIKAQLGFTVVVGEIQLPRFSAPILHVLFKCKQCNKLSIDYLHGHKRIVYCHHHNVNEDLKKELTTATLD